MLPGSLAHVLQEPVATDFVRPQRGQMVGVLLAIDEFYALLPAQAHEGRQCNF